ncbi:hypothetical protein [Parvicella tangerina]|uniref:Uncharacterized protein n=1 Tax=Parvicella tangerina TaxID=2829795 RepID=A0A916JMK5_9FLAO|nr:hypothetical protein [Parvicella tangerina]CAG5081908.1 hypothetical protein CRYO30217_01759 [Parvicella tangerina]
MIEGAIIGVIVAIVLMIIKKNREKKALAKVKGENVLDEPDFAAFFHCASEETFNKKGVKFFDSNGVLTLNGTKLNYQPEQSDKPGIEVDIQEANLKVAPIKRKMKWVEIEVDGDKYYLTTFKQGAFSIDNSEMNDFLELLVENRSDFN